MSDMRFLDDEGKRRVRLKLTELQGERSDAEMARLLGCTRPHWWNVKHDRRGASYALVKRAIQVFPTLSLVVMQDLSGETPRERAS
jgi:hypothetical protein